jgi:deoxyribonuclease V
MRQGRSREKENQETKHLRRRELDPAETAFFADVQKLLHREKTLLPRDISRICAVDAAYRDDQVVAVASLFVHGRLTETCSYSGTCSLPYHGGLFYLREGPFAVQAVRGLKARPQLVCFDAHGVAHPRFAGLATVGGMVLGIPSVGIAKSLLVGTVTHATKSLQRIVYRGRTVGFVTRTDGVKRYWSPGYAVNITNLASEVSHHRQTCLSAMSESHRAARAVLSTLPKYA